MRSSPILVALATFAAFTLAGNTLTADKAFTGTVHYYAIFTCSAMHHQYRLICLYCTASGHAVVCSTLITYSECSSDARIL
jgi:hypothetical protein